MALSQFHDTYVRDKILFEYQRQATLLEVIRSGAASAQVLQMATEGRAPGTFAKAINITALKGSDYTPTSGTETISSLPSGVTSTTFTYSDPTDTTVNYKIDQFTYSTRFLNKYDARAHDAGAYLKDGIMMQMMSEMIKAAEENVVADVLAHGAFESVSGETGTNFGLDTTTADTFKADMAILHGQANAYNWPRESRVIIGNGKLESVVTKHGTLVSRDYSIMANGDVATGQFWEYGSFRFLFCNSFSATQAAALDTDKYAFCLPVGPDIDVYDESDKAGLKIRMCMQFGRGSIGLPVLGADGNAPTTNLQREGIMAITVV